MTGESVEVRQRSSAVRCAICHGDLAAPESSCSACRTVYHEDCGAQHGRCPTLACKGFTVLDRVERALREAPPLGEHWRAWVACGWRFAVVALLAIYGTIWGGTIIVIALRDGHHVATPIFLAVGLGILYAAYRSLRAALGFGRAAVTFRRIGREAPSAMYASRWPGTRTVELRRHPREALATFVLEDAPEWANDLVLVHGAGSEGPLVVRSPEGRSWYVLPHQVQRPGRH